MMKVYSRILCLLALALFGGNIIGQSVNHAIEVLEEGEILVLSNLVQGINNSGEQVKTGKYQAITTADVSIEDCLKVMKETSLHNDIIRNASRTEKIKTISDDEWYSYYYFSGAFGMPDYDAVMKMQCFINEANNSFTILGTASPGLIESRGVGRIESYEILCAVRELEDDKVEISISAEYTPVNTAPDWKIKMCYPEPVSLLEGMIWLAEGI